jgi:uncharacterized RDD family membrane protein YckC
MSSVNSDTQETALECAKEAGAIVKCRTCGEYDVCAYGEEAEKRAYVIAEQTRKMNERGFRGMSRQEVKDILRTCCKTREVVHAVIMLIIFWLYFSVFESSRIQATPGKWICRLLVTDLSGRKISFGRATGRYFAKTVSALPYLVGYSAAAVSRRKQAWHDMMSGCVVLRTTRDRRADEIPVVLPGVPWWRWVLSLPLGLLVAISILVILILPHILFH